MVPTLIKPVKPVPAAPLELCLMSLAGEELVAVPDARADWLYQDVANALATKLPLQEGKGQMYKFVCGEDVLKPGVPLSEYGLGENGRSELTALVITHDSLLKLEQEGKPMLKAAHQALERLSKRAFAELRAFKTPAPLALSTVQAVYSVLSRPKIHSDIGWEEAISVLRDHQALMKQFQAFEYMQNPGEIMQRLSKFVEQPDFYPEYVRRCSMACEAMCLWCRAVYACAKLAVEAESVWL